MDNLLESLAAPFPPECIDWRVGSTNKEKTRGMALAYIDARDVMRRLDEVCGSSWQCEYVPMSNGTTCCRIGIDLGDGVCAWRSNGAGNTDYEAEKGAYSDAFKRAAVLWGIGRYLYEFPSPWVEIEQRGRSYVIKESELPRLQALLKGEKTKSAYQARKDGDYPRLEAGLRACGTLEELQAFWRSEQAVITKLPDGWRQALTDEKDRLKAELMRAAA